MTEPDEGPITYRTTRWAGPVVTYTLAGSWPAQYRAEIHGAFAFAAEATGLQVVETTAPADITVVPKADNGAHVTAWPRADRTLARVVVELGCCRPRAAWEDVLQAFGPMGDHGPPGTLFSEDVTAVRAGPFEACVLRLLYRHPPGTAAAELEGAKCP